MGEKDGHPVYTNSLQSQGMCTEMSFPKQGPYFFSVMALSPSVAVKPGLNFRVLLWVLLVRLRSLEIVKDLCKK